MSQVQQARSAQEILRSLGISQETVVTLPTGGGFTGGGFIGPLHAAHMYSVGVQGEEVEESTAVTVTQRGGWVWYYFLDKDAGDQFDKEHGGQYGKANPVHRVELATRKLVAPESIIAERIEQFGEIIGGDVRRMTFASKMYRHEWNLIAFPSLVHAAAELFGYNVPEFNIDDLRRQDTDFDDELFERLCGDPNAKAGEESYTRSVYYQQRAKLWAALGESDPTKCHTIEEKTSFSTTSKELSECLMLASSTWTAPIYGRLRLVADPRPKAISSTGNRISLGIVSNLYYTEAEAREAAASEQSDESGAVSAAISAGPDVPESWVAYGYDAAKFAQEIRDSAAKPLKIVATEMELDTSVISTWREYLGL